MGGEVPAAVASQLQADPDIDYVFFSFGSLSSGVTATLDSAGLLDQVTVYGQDFSAFDLEEIVAGTMGAWSADPKAYAGWLMVDAAARLSLGMELTEERDAALAPDVPRRGRGGRAGDPRLLQRRLVAADDGRGLQGPLGRLTRQSAITERVTMPGPEPTGPGTRVLWYFLYPQSINTAEPDPVAIGTSCALAHEGEVT